MLGLNPEDTRSNTFLLAVAMAFGIGISVLAFAIAPISGGHINPAVTFAFVLLKGLNPILGLMYVAAQCVGAVLGAALVYGTFASSQLEHLSGSRTPPFMLGVNLVSPGIPVGSGFLGEMMGTLFLVFTVLMTAVYKHVSVLFVQHIG
jgi:glycerol uptake facilitator-like aquaporin